MAAAAHPAAGEADRTDAPVELAGPLRQRIHPQPNPQRRIIISRSKISQVGFGVLFLAGKLVRRLVWTNFLIYE